MVPPAEPLSTPASTGPSRSSGCGEFRALGQPPENDGLVRMRRAAAAHPVCRSNRQLFPVNSPFYRFTWESKGDSKRYQLPVNRCDLGRLNHLIETMAMYMHWSSWLTELGQPWRCNDEHVRRVSQSEPRTRSTSRRFNEDTPHSRGR